jgi:hypothetical protein
VNGPHAPGSETPLVAEPLQVTLADPMRATVYTQTPGSGAWTVTDDTQSASIAVAVNQYPLVVALAPESRNGRAVELPQGVPTPGPTETPRPKRTSESKVPQ